MKKAVQIVFILALLVIPSGIAFADEEKPNNNDGISISKEHTPSQIEIEGFEALLRIYEKNGMKNDESALKNYLSIVSNPSKNNGIQSISPQSVFDWFYMIDSYQQGLAQNTTGGVYVAQVMYGYAVDHWGTVRSRVGNYEVKIKRLSMLARAWDKSNNNIYEIRFGFNNASDVYCRRTDAPKSGYARSDVTFSFEYDGDTILWAGGNY